MMEALFGSPQDAERQVGAAKDPPAALTLALSGAVTRAEQLVNALDVPGGAGPVQIAGIRAAIALQRNNPGQAIEMLRPVAEYEPGGPSLIGIYLRGLANLQAGRGTAAAVEFQKIIDHPGTVPLSPVHPLAHLGVGRAYALMGDHEKARTAYGDFFRKWNDADPDIPILRSANDEFAKLSP
jgi:hypothetical protein